MLKKWMILFFLLPASLKLTAQESNGPETSPLTVGLKSHYGFVIPHYPELRKISDKNYWGAQVEISKLQTSRSAWSTCNCYKRLGLSFDYFNYRKPDVLGESFNLVFFVEPYITFRSPFRLSFRGGIGLTYLNQVYDEETNPDNLFYSSPISGILLLNFTLNYLVRDQYQFNLSSNYNHISNAGLEVPNKGMNFPSISAGLDYYLEPVELESREKYLGFQDNKYLPYLKVFWSVRTVEASDNYPEEKKMMIGLEGGVLRRLSHINALLLAIEASYDGSFDERSDRMNESYAPYVVSLHAGNAFVLGKFYFTLQMAWYAYQEFPATSKSFFQRYSIYHKIGERLLLGFSLKAHGHVAEHMDIRIGVEF